MRRFGFTASLAASIAVAAIVVNCSSDTRTGDPPSAPSSIGSTSVPGSVSLVGGGWSPAVETDAQTNHGDKVSVCHSGNGNHFVQIDVSTQAARAHLGNPSSGRGGHTGDYRVSANTPCPPPATPGEVQVCKVAGTGLAAGTNFSFTVAANAQSKQVTVAAGAGPTGTCVSGGSYRVGTTVTVSEGAQTGVKTASIVVTPAGAQQGTSDLANRSATAIVGVGTTTLTFTNNGPSGTLVICKVGGTGVTAGTNFTFAVGNQTATVAAGAGPDGTCSAPMALAVGAVTVSETGSAGTIASAIAGTPAPTDVNLPARSATTQITADQQSKITFTNVAATAANSGTLTICKVAGNGITAGTNFTFNVAGQTATVAAGAAPNGTCGSAITLPVGAVTVTETAVNGTSVSAITGTPAAPTSINLAGRSAAVQIVAGQETHITFTNTAP